MEALVEALKQLLKTNTLLGGEIPPISNIFQQLEALSALCFPYESYDGSAAILFQSPFWDTLDRVPVTRQVFGIEQFHNRTQLLLSALGKDPYSFETIKEYQPIGLATFPEQKPIFLPTEFKDPRRAIELVKDYVDKTDTTLVVRLDATKKQPQFFVQSCFNPYFQYLRQREKGICVSPDLICNQAHMLNVVLIHKNTKPMVQAIQTGFNPQVGLNIMPLNKEGLSDALVSDIPEGFPYNGPLELKVEEQETKKAGPGNFEL